MWNIVIFKRLQEYGANSFEAIEGVGGAHNGSW
jgi:hypothetical protein